MRSLSRTVRRSMRFSYARALEDALHEDAGRVDLIGIERPRLDELLDLGDR